MKETIISFQVAKLAQEKGWKNNGSFDKAFYICQEDEFYFSEYEVGDLIMNEDGGSYSNKNLIADAPTQSLLQKWLREIHKIHLYVYPYKDHAADNNDPIEWKSNFGKAYKSYEEALETALFEALKHI